MDAKLDYKDLTGSPLSWRGSQHSVDTMLGWYQANFPKLPHEACYILAREAIGCPLNQFEMGMWTKEAKRHIKREKERLKRQLAIKKHEQSHPTMKVVYGPRTLIFD